RQSVHPVGARPRRLPASGRRAAQRRPGARGARHGGYRRRASQRPGSPRGLPWGRHQRVSRPLPRAAPLVDLAAHPVQRLAHGDLAAAGALRQQRPAPGRPRRGRAARALEVRRLAMVLLGLFGGLALLLYGMQLCGEGLQRAAGGHLRHVLTSMTRNRLTAMCSGALVTTLIQSSSATTLMLIGFVSAGLLTFRQSLGVILGADIGTTFTVQLIAFKVQELALLLVGVGFALSFFARRGLAKSLGQVVLGF